MDRVLRLFHLQSSLRLEARQPKWDWLAVSAAEVGLVFTTVVLITGPIWAHPVWGIWWTWDARLTSTFVLWLLYVSYLLLRTLIEEPDRRALLSSLFGIFAFLDVPLVFGAIRWWRTQHPQPVIMGGPGSGLDPTMSKVLFFFVFAMHVFAAFLIVERYVLEKMKNEVDILQREAEAYMRNLNSVFAAYIIGWGVFFLFYITIAKRTNDLRAEIDRLKNALPRAK